MVHVSQQYLFNLKIKIKISLSRVNYNYNIAAWRRIGWMMWRDGSGTGPSYADIVEALIL